MTENAPSGVIPSRGHLLFALFLSAVTAVSMTFVFWLAERNNGYGIGEWLMNYSAGFVRRGLIGQLILLFGHATSMPLTWIVFTLQVAAYLLFIACVYRIVLGLRWTFLTAAIAVSPGTFGFFILSEWSGYRKEILLFAALSLAMCLLLSPRVHDWQLAVFFSVVGPALVLSHEALIVGAPYFVAAVVIEKGAHRALRILGSSALVSILALLAVYLHPGDLAMAQAMCASIGSTLKPFGSPDPNVCSGSIAWLQFSLQDAQQIIKPDVDSHHFLRRFSFWGILSFAPMALALFLRYRENVLRQRILVVAWCSTLGLLGMVLLCWTALDWGRWIHMQAMCLMLVIFLLERHVPAKPPAPFHHRNPRVLATRLASTLLVMLYATTWWLPAVGLEDYKESYLGTARAMVSFVRNREASKRPPGTP